MLTLVDERVTREFARLLRAATAVKHETIVAEICHVHPLVIQLLVLIVHVLDHD